MIVIGTGGKGTGAGTMFPVVQMARAQRKLVIPIFVRPSFERHEVDKRRYDHALSVVERFDSAKIRLIEILNDQGYADADPQPQSVVWERMNLPIARGLRGLLYVLSDLSQVDPSDLSMLFAGSGRLRMGFAEIDPPDGQDPSDEQVDEAVRTCWQNSYYSFSKPVGTSLVCIQGDWSNVVDAGIKGGLATLATDGVRESLYTPLYARAVQRAQAVGVTALFAEDTGAHAPLDIDWSSERRPERPCRPRARPRCGRAAANVHRRWPVAASRRGLRTPFSGEPAEPRRRQRTAPPSKRSPRLRHSGTLPGRVNRSDPAALAIARNDATGGISIDAGEVRKLLGTMWFRGVVAQLSEPWRRRVLDVLVGSMVVPDHVLKVDHRDVRLSELTFAQLSDLVKRVSVPEAARADIDLLISVGRLWGGDAVARLQFVPMRPTANAHGLSGCCRGFAVSHLACRFRDPCEVGFVDAAPDAGAAVRARPGGAAVHAGDPAAALSAWARPAVRRAAGSQRPTSSRWRCRRRSS